MSVKVIHESISRLLNQFDNENSLECLCRLLSTIGKDLEQFVEQPMPSDVINTSSSTRAKVSLYIILKN